MKKKAKLLIALLLVFVGVGLTYAVYTTSVGGNANVETANWLIKVKTGSNFENQVGIDVSGGATDIDLGECEKLAPGGNCTLPFRVDATGTEVDTILTVELGSNVTGATLVELEAAGINLRISDGVNEDYAYLLNMGSYKDLNLVINWEAGDEDDDEKAEADVNIANKLSSITIPVNMVVKQRTGGLRTVTFNTHDSNIETPESIQVNDGNSIAEANIPVLVKNGYIFLGWYTSEVGGVQLTSSTPIIDNMEYHARFRERQNVTVSFNTHGGSEVNSVSVMEGNTLSELPSAPTRLGYNFVGWYTAETGGEAVTTSTIIDNTVEFHAQWTIKYVTVTFDSNGGSNVASQQMQEGSTFASIPDSTNGDYILDGWYDSNDQKLTTSTPIMESKTYTARWKEAYVGTLVYYDPVSTSTCNSSTFSLDAVKNGTSTCYKWRILETNEEVQNVRIQMDHNLVNKVAWNETGNNNDGPIKVLSELATATSTWSRVPALNYTYDTSDSAQNYGTLSCINGACTISKSNTTIGDNIIQNPNGTPVRARLITGEEVAEITRTQTDGTTIADTWSLSNQDWYHISKVGKIVGTQTNGTGNTKLKWMVENTKISTAVSSSGSTVNVYSDRVEGYWTLTPRAQSSSRAYFVYNYGTFDWDDYENHTGYNATVSIATYFGARPVITVSKSDLSFN